MTQWRLSPFCNYRKSCSYSCNLSIKHIDVYMKPSGHLLIAVSIDDGIQILAESLSGSGLQKLVNLSYSMPQTFSWISSDSIYVKSNDTEAVLNPFNDETVLSGFYEFHPSYLIHLSFFGHLDSVKNILSLMTRYLGFCETPDSLPIPFWSFFSASSNTLSNTQVISRIYTLFQSNRLKIMAIYSPKKVNHRKRNMDAGLKAIQTFYH